MIYKSLVPNLLAIAKNAGLAIMAIYNDSEGIKIERKADDSPLTKADKTANDIICKGLNDLPVQYPIISEENKTLDYTVRKNYDHVWMVDPLDGTKEFIKRNGEFTVNIALIKEHQVIMGIVYAPALEEMYYAIKGVGAFFIDHSGVEQKISAAEFGLGDPSLGVVCSRSHLNEATQQFVNNLNQPKLVSKGSSLKFLILASGGAHLYPRLAPTMEWDTAAAQIILEEAGGSVINNETASPLMYNKENLLNPFFIAYGHMKN